MKQKKMLTLTFSQLKQVYGQEIPEIVEIADKSSTVEDFKAGILRLLETCRIENEAAEEAREQIRLLLDYDGQNVHELSTGQDMSVQTIRLLYEFLTGTLENMEMPTDLFIEIFQMFKRLKGEITPLPSPQRIKSRNDRWETGLDEEVREIRDENKERMLHLLIQKIENRKSKPSVRFHFEEGMSYEEKYRLVSEWWNDFRFHLAMAVKSPGELNRFLGNSLSSETMYLLYRARKKGMPFLRLLIIYRYSISRDMGIMMRLSGVIFCIRHDWWRRMEIFVRGKRRILWRLVNLMLRDGFCRTDIIFIAGIRRWLFSFLTRWEGPAGDFVLLASGCMISKANG